MEKDNFLKSRFCLSCKIVEMSLRSFWHNTVNMGEGMDEVMLGWPYWGCLM